VALVVLALALCLLSHLLHIYQEALDAHIERLEAPSNSSFVPAN